MKPRRTRVSLVLVHEGKLLGFHIEDPVSKAQYFILPGGAIESGETPEQAVIRETLEETGYESEIASERSVTLRYDFEWSGVVVDCITTFFLGRLKSHAPTEVHDADYHRGVAWISTQDIQKVFNYSEPILKGIQAILEDSIY